MRLLACLILAAVFAGCSSNKPKGPSYSNKLFFVKEESREYYIHWKDDGLNGWTATPDRLRGWIMVNGVQCERFRPGYDRQHLKNAYLRGHHGVDIKRGQVVEIYLQDMHDPSKRTNPLSFTWPWKNTR